MFSVFVYSPAHKRMYHVHSYQSEDDCNSILQSDAERPSELSDIAEESEMDTSSAGDSDLMDEEEVIRLFVGLSEANTRTLCGVSFKTLSLFLSLSVTFSLSLFLCFLYADFVSNKTKGE